MNSCIVCEKAAEMEFNCLTGAGILCAHLCLDCWGLAGTDTEVVFIIIHKRKEQLCEVFSWLTDARLSWGKLEKQHGPERMEQVKGFLLSGEGE